MNLNHVGNETRQDKTARVGLEKEMSKFTKYM